MATCANCSSTAIYTCVRCRNVRYCTKKCQIIHWKAGHKKVCGKESNVSHEERDAQSDESPAAESSAAESSAAESSSDSVSCFICLETTGNLVRGCACRGSAGYVVPHAPLNMLVKFACRLLFVP